MTKNTESTRYYSALQEESVCKVVKGKRQPNSGASNFSAGDVVNKDASILIECKTTLKDKDSFSIKKEWLEKNKEEMRSLRLSNHCLAFNFGPNQTNYFIIDEKLMKFLISNLEEANMEE